MRRIVCFRVSGSSVSSLGIITKQINQHKDILPTKYVILPTRYYWLIEKNHMFPTQKYQNFGSLAPLACNYLWVLFEFHFSGRKKIIMKRTISRVLRAQGHNLLYRQTMWFINKILRRIVCFRPKNTNNFGSLAISYSFFLIFWFSGRCKKNPTRKYKNFGSLAIIYGVFSSFWFSGRYKKYIYVSDAKVHKFRLARSHLWVKFSRVSGKFLVGINRHEQETKKILKTQLFPS